MKRWSPLLKWRRRRDPADRQVTTPDGQFDIHTIPVDSGAEIRRPATCFVEAAPGLSVRSRGQKGAAHCLRMVGRARLSYLEFGRDDHADTSCRTGSMPAWHPVKESNEC